MADSFTITQSISNTITLNDPIIDGHIRYTGDYNKNITNTILFFGRISDAPEILRAFVECDISSIPSNATINVVKFLYHGYTHGIDCHIHECLGERPSTNTTAQTLYSECGEGTIYADIDNFPVAGSNQVITLGANSTASACVDLKNQISSGWFAIGLQSDNENTTTVSSIYSEDYDAANPKPSLYVAYDVTSTATLNQPQHVTYSNMRKMEKHLFPDGTFKQHDIGAGGKTVVLEGCETTDAETTMQTIDSMMNNGEKITISDMDYDDLNTDWYIKGFRWEQREGYVNIYDWQLTLVEA